MWKYAFNQRDVQRVLGADWDLGTVRVCKEADSCGDGSFDFIEQLLLRHLSLETGELQADEATNRAIASAQQGGKGYVTLFNYCGTVFKVETHVGHRITDVTVADDDYFSRQRLSPNFETLLEEQQDAEAEAEEESAD